MNRYSSAIQRASLFALLLLGFIAFNVSGARAQGVAGGTVISNRVAVSYTEPEGSTVNTISNTVTVTVQNVTGLVITPDAAITAGVNAGATGVTRFITISNTGNINESISFGASGASLIVSGPATVTAAYVDVNDSETFDAGDIDIRSSTGPLSLNFGRSVNVIVVLDVSPAATAGQTINVQLGDASGNAPSHDNVPADASAGSVKTVGSTGINGNLEARGDLSIAVNFAGAVFIGPFGQPLAVGPTSNNDDYTNKTLTAGVNVPMGGVTTSGGNLVFINTIRNSSTASDTITITAPTIPAGFTVSASTNGGTSFTPLDSGGTATITIAAGTDANIYVRVVAPSAISVLSGYSTVIRATSGITPQNFNETIDRLWTGFIRADKAVSVANSTGVGGPTDAVPGAVMTYTITYTNVTASSGTGNADLTATNVVLTEDGNAAPNNWATTTNHVAGSASDSRGGAITGDVAGSNLLTDTVPSLAPGQSGAFTFKRTIR